MAEETSASIIQLHQPKKKAPLSGAERARLYRERKKAGSVVIEPLAADDRPGHEHVEPRKAVRATEVLVDDQAARSRLKVEPSTVGALVPLQGGDLVRGQVTHGAPLAPVTAPVTSVTPVTASRHVTASRPLAPALLTVAAFGLAGVGVTMNGWFARSLGSSDIAGWLFLAIGVAADATAFAVPSCAARLWQARQRGAALTGWLVWAMTFAFAVTAGIGFASTNISDVTEARASRVTPAVTQARAELSDAMASRDRECAGGVGKVCRQREDAVTARRQSLDDAMHAVGQTADPQTDAAIRVVAWLTGGLLRPTSNDFAMLRLVLLAILPQIGGVLLMVGRAGK
jgi:hypothetical protein